MAIYCATTKCDQNFRRSWRDLARAIFYSHRTPRGTMLQSLNTRNQGSDGNRKNFCLKWSKKVLVQHHDIRDRNKLVILDDRNKLNIFVTWQNEKELTLVFCGRWKLLLWRGIISLIKFYRHYVSGMKFHTVYIYTLTHSTISSRSFHPSVPYFRRDTRSLWRK